MIAIDIPFRTDDPKSVIMEEVPAAIRNAISGIHQEYPKLENNKTNNMKFDRLFEQLYNCKVEYNENNAVSRIIWKNEHDYTIFLLRWS